MADEARLLWQNKADSLTLTASTSSPGMPVSNLILKPNVFDDVWRSTAEPAWVRTSAVEEVDLIALFGLQVGANATVRLRISETDPTVESDYLFDQTFTAADPELDYRYSSFVYLHPDVIVGPVYVRLDIADPDLAAIVAGRLVIGEAQAVTYNFDFGAVPRWNDPSPKQKTRAGNTLIWRQPRYRSASFTFGMVPEAEAWGLFEDIARENGASRDVLIIFDPGADSIPQRAIWGCLTETGAHQYLAAHDHFAEEFQIEERL